MGHDNVGFKRKGASPIPWASNEPPLQLGLTFHPGCEVDSSENCIASKDSSHDIREVKILSCYCVVFSPHGDRHMCFRFS
jgi:hypothetical protein